MERGLRAGALTTHRDRLPRSAQYELLVRIASGGMATVYVGRRTGLGGFSRLVAVKRAHAHLLEDPAFADMLVAEAKIAARIHHPNVVAVQSVEIVEGEVLLVMDYVEGASLSELMLLSDAKGTPVPPGVVARVILDACAGLHAAHTTTDEHGAPLGLIHRDVSPQNILVGVDGAARIGDFGIAKSTGGETHGLTASGTLKGKVSYMAPEYVTATEFDARSDVFAMGVVAWEALTGQRLFRGANEVETLKQVIATRVAAPSSVAPLLGTAFDAVILRAVARDRDKRWLTARAFSEALEAAARDADRLATPGAVADFVRAVAGSALDHRLELLRLGAAQKSESSIRVVGRAEATGTLDVESPDKSKDADYTAMEVVLDEVAAPSPSDASEGSFERASTDPVARGGRRLALGIVAAVLVAGAAVGMTFARRPEVQSVAPAVAAPPSSPVESPSVPSEPSAVAVEPAHDLTAMAAASGSTTPPIASARSATPRATAPAAPRTVPRAVPRKVPDRAPPNPYPRTE